MSIQSVDTCHNQHLISSTAMFTRSGDTSCRSPGHSSLNGVENIAILFFPLIARRLWEKTFLRQFSAAGRSNNPK